MVTESGCLSPRLAVSISGRGPILLYLESAAPNVMLAQSRCPPHNVVTHLLSPYSVPGPELGALSKLSHFILKITLLGEMRLRFREAEQLLQVTQFVHSSVRD